MNPNDLPATNRPECISDLPSYELEDEIIFELKDELAEDKDHLDFWLAVVESAKKNPKMRVRGTQIRRMLTAENIEAKLKEAQETYDKNRERYRKILTGEAEVSEYDAWGADRYARAENLPKATELHKEDED